MNTHEYFEHGIKTHLSRRNMIAALMSGSVALSLPAISKASTPSGDETCVLPTPADALAFYLEFLGSGTISYEILRPYFVLIGSTSTELNRKYLELKAKVSDLQKLVPELKTNKEFCQLSSATDAGKTSTSYLKRAGDGAVTMVAAQSVMISYVSGSLNNSAGNLKEIGDGVMLSEAAVKKLREIICDIEDLLTPTRALDAASTALTTADNFLRSQTAIVVAKIKQAISALVAGEIKKTSIAEARSTALRLLDEAERNSKDFETYSIPDELKKRLDEYRALHPEARMQPSDNSGAIPALQHFREFLAGVKVWIGRDDWVAGHQVDDGGVRFVNASYKQTSTMYLGIIREIQRILNDHLPEGTGGRAFYCYTRVKIIFFGNYDEETRKKKIEGVLQYIMPRGDSDGNPQKRAEAAGLLNALPFS